jgi:hypothetical protein
LGQSTFKPQTHSAQPFYGFMTRRVHPICDSGWIIEGRSRGANVRLTGAIREKRRPARPWLKRGAPAVGLCPAPFGREPLGVLVEQLLGIDTVTGECPAAEMVDDQVTSDRQLKPCAVGPFGEIVGVKEPESKPLVEPTDLLINGSLHEQAESRSLGTLNQRPRCSSRHVRAKRCISSRLW